MISDRAWTRLTPRLILEELRAVEGIVGSRNHVEVRGVIKKVRGRLTLKVMNTVDLNECGRSGFC